MFPRVSRRAALDALELLVVLGKGGVGKTAVAAALGTALAARGRRVLVVEVDPRESLNDYFGAAPSAGEVVRAGSTDGSLRFLNLKPRAALDAFVEEKLRLGPLARRAIESPAYQRFAESAPGLAELALLGQARRIVLGEVKAARDVDLVIIDAPATGHGVALLEAPGLVAETIDRGPFGRLGAELAQWIADVRRVAVAAVALPEELPVQETLELVDRLRIRFGRGPIGIFLNGVLPAVAGGSWPDPATEKRWQALLDLQQSEERRLRDGAAQLPVRLPFVEEDRGTGLLARLLPAVAQWIDGEDR
jgi:hypothetical protein